jgi:Cu(I)/Ag(I) efflux system membrane protein CusA/SilA
MKFLVSLAIGVLAASASHAQMSPEMKMPAASPPSPGASAVLTNGVVQQVDAKTGTVTLKHEDITNMKMPAMTMAFGVADKKMLESVKAGDKVRFHLEMLKGAPTVTRIEQAR